MGDAYGWARSPVRGHSSAAMVESRSYTSVTWQPRLELVLLVGVEIRGWISVGLGSYIQGFHFPVGVDVGASGG